MAGTDPAMGHTPGDEEPLPAGGTPDEPRTAAELRRRKTVRMLVPVGVAGVAAATIGLVPALANSGPAHPDLPKTSAEQLLTKLAASDVQTVSGSVRMSSDLGLPALPGMSGSGAAGGSPFGPAPRNGGGDSGTSSADPQSKLTELASGSHTLRIAADGPDRQRVSIEEDTAEYSLIHNGKDVWAYDSASNAVFHTQDPEAGKQAGAAHGGKAQLPDGFPATPGDFAKQALSAVDPSTSVTVDGTTRVAGQDAYRLLIKPKQSGSTIGSIAIAVDADNGAPLKFTLTPTGGGKAAVDVGFTDVSFGKPAAKNFQFTPPKGAKVTEGKDRQQTKTPSGTVAPSAFGVVGKGWNSVAKVELPAGALDRGAKDGTKDGAAKGFDAKSLLSGLGDRVNGGFGGGTVIHTRLVNVLLTDKGTVYAGAVTKDALVAAADQK
jgi:outer membrane lipoprotein-sorting protein